MDRSNKFKNSPKEHITAIFEDYEASARVLQTLTNLSNTVIETALSGQCKFLFEILQNADDAFDDQSKYRDIKLQLILLDNYFIIQHNGKVFNYYDVERICDYASQIEEVKANDLSKTGYKGLGFKSLFNLSDCIHIYSNGYSFRFDKNYWPNPEMKPWQVIPIWCDSLPLSEKYTYDQPVTFIMKIKDERELNIQLKELTEHPEILLYMHRVNSLYLNFNGMKHNLERKMEVFGLFHKIKFLKNQRVVSTWLSRTYERAVSPQLKKYTQEVSQFIFPDKIKNADEVVFTFSLCTDEMTEKVIKIDGFCYSTLPTQLRLSLPYHVNSLFILNLDRTQFHENEWNEFLVYQTGYLQLNFLKDIAEVPNLKNFVISLLVRKIKHPYKIFNNAFLKGFEEAKREIAWLPAYKETHLLKLGEAWIDKIHFFKQNFKNIQDRICSFLIDYDVKEQNVLLTSEAKCFDYDSLFDHFPHKYYPQLTENSYKEFLGYLYEISKMFPLGSSKHKLMDTPFLKTKDRTLISPQNALLEKKENPIPYFAALNPVDNKYLPIRDTESFKRWLVYLGARPLDSPIQIIRESIFQWIESDTLHCKMNMNNHKTIIDYLAKNFDHLTGRETETLKDELLILTKSNQFKKATSCYLPIAIPLKELREIISDDEVISSCYDTHSLRYFFNHLGISENLTPIQIFHKCIEWIKNGEMKSKLTTKNYKPIIEYLSSEYQNIEYLIKDKNKLLKKMPILTCNQTFQEAGLCCFDTAVPNIQGFENAIEKHKLVSTQNLKKNVREFLAKIGVSENIDPTYVIRETVLKWIKEGTVQSRINASNHHDILKYVAEHWNDISNQYSYPSLKADEKKLLRILPILTKDNIFREACICYWQTTDVYGSDKKIPKLELIISPDELVSSEYKDKYTKKEEIFLDIKNLFNDLGVRYLKFVDVYDRFCDHLTDIESIEWFFFNLVKYWENHEKSADKNKLLIDLKAKLHSTHLLGKNDSMYPLSELYSSHFSNISNIDINAIPLLAYENLPNELERWLGIKQELELPCIIKLLESADKKENLGEELTLAFFCTMLEQLRLKDKNEIKKYPLKLLSNDNKLTLAKDLHYFKEEDAICIADSCYLKRIHGMSHDKTLELAELCGVNLFPFDQEITYGDEKVTYDKTLEEFYLERLPLIVLEESKKLNESPLIVLKKLFPKVSSIESYKCKNILIKYPFDKPVETDCNFDHLKVYSVREWENYRTKIHKHIKEKLEFTSDITGILDMVSVSESKTEWLRLQKRDPDELLIIEKELKKLLLGQETDYLAAEKQDFNNEDISSIELSPKQETGCGQVKAAVVNQSVSSGGESITKHDLFKQSTDCDSFENESIASNDLLKQDLGFQHLKLEQSADSEDKSNSNDDSSFKQDVTSGLIKATAFNQSVNETLTKFTKQSTASLIRTSGDYQGKMSSSNDVNFELQKPTNDNTKFNKQSIANLIRASGDYQGKMSSSNDVNFGLQKPTNDNTLREFYLRRLPCIVQWESKEQNRKPEEIFNGLSKKICSIELYQCSDIHIQYPHSFAAKTHCFFDGLKIYVVGKWVDYEIEIHQYIKEKLCLHIHVTDIINLKPQAAKKEWISSEKDEPEKLHQVEEEMKTFVPADEILTNEQQFTSDQEYPKDTELSEDEEFVPEAFSEGNSKDSFDYRPCSSRPYYSIKFDGSKVLVTFSERAGNVGLLQDTKDDAPRLKKLGEKYVFIFLQDYYKNKYPDAQFNLEHGHFTLEWQSHTIEIIWLNESEDRGLEHDLLVKKNEEVKQCIEVKSVNQGNSDSFNLAHCIIIRNQFPAEHPECNGKYCVYCVLCEVDSSVLLAEEMANINALYKIVPLKLPSI